MSDMDGVLIGRGYVEDTSLSGRTPIERRCELLEQTPLSCAAYDPTQEPVKERQYWLDQRLRQLKRCL